MSHIHARSDAAARPARLTGAMRGVGRTRDALRPALGVSDGGDGGERRGSAVCLFRLSAGSGELLASCSTDSADTHTAPPPGGGGEEEAGGGGGGGVVSVLVRDWTGGGGAFTCRCCNV